MLWDSVNGVFTSTQLGCEAHKWSVTVFSPEFLGPLGGGVSDGGCSVKCDFWILPPSPAATTPPLASSKSPQRTSSPCLNLHKQEHIFVGFLYFRVCADETRGTKEQQKPKWPKHNARMTMENSLQSSLLFFRPKPSSGVWKADLLSPGSAFSMTLFSQEKRHCRPPCLCGHFKYQIQTGRRLTSLHSDRKCLPQTV